MRVQGPLLTLIVLMFLIFFAQSLFGDAWYRELMAVPLEVMTAWRHAVAGGISTADWREFGTLLSCAFLHGSFEHVGYNMLFFWIFGALLVELLGWRWMIGIFVLTAIAASLTHVLLNREDPVPMLGASGAVMGFEGAYLGLAVRWRLPDPHIWPMSRPIPPGQLALLAGIGVMFDYFALAGQSDSMIAYGAHIGGFTLGLMITALITPRPRSAGVRRS